MKILSKIKKLYSLFIQEHSVSIVTLRYGNIWNYRKYLIDNKISGGGKLMLYDSYWTRFGSYIGLGAHLEDIPIFPHGPIGVFISNSAQIGKNCVVFQQVTIGSNTLKESKSYGAPTIEDNVYIGCGAKIIGNVHVGNNARIGANAIVVKDVPANSVTITRGTETILRDSNLDNEFIPNVPKIDTE